MKNRSAPSSTTSLNLGSGERRARTPLVRSQGGRDTGLWILGLAGSLTVFGALPFLMTPTSLEALWTMGFAESFATGPIWQVRADDFGLPHPAPIAFGLAGAWPASLLLRLGVPAADAYTLMVAGWLTVAYWSACRVGRLLGTNQRVAVLGGVTWLCMPIVWGHAGYSQLALGIALLPLYLLPALSVATQESPSPRHEWKLVLGFLGTCFIAVFMDGYTFIMLACGSVLVLAGASLAQPARRREILRLALPAQLGALAIAYLTYVAYIGGATFDSRPIEFFRAYAVDLTFLWVPHSGTAWLGDAVGLSADRPSSDNWGDGSVWTTTFAAPILVAGVVAWWQGRRRSFLYGVFFATAVLGLYMSLGPSLKIASSRGPLTQPFDMPADAAIMPTGNAAFSAHLPGFDMMRSSYRWLALCVLACWLLVLLRWAHSSVRSRQVWALSLVLVTALNVPDMPRNLENKRNDRASMQRLERDLVPELKARIGGRQRVLFLPAGNDYLVNYLAPRADFKTFNVGGDKNLRIAQSYWPALVTEASSATSIEQARAIEQILVADVADSVVLPYFSMIDAAASWPCGVINTLWSLRRGSAELQYEGCMWATRTTLAPLIAKLESISHLRVTNSEFFLTVDIPDTQAAEAGRPGSQSPLREARARTTPTTSVELASS